MQRRLIAFAECYANACVAEEVSDVLKRNNIDLEVMHQPVYGRDRVLKRASRMTARLPPNTFLVLFIV